jgi:hypothetical protein
MHLFPGEMDRLTVTYCAYKADATEDISSHCFSLLPCHLFLLLSPLLRHSCLELHGH